jgi:hypothetical protein
MFMLCVTLSPPIFSELGEIGIIHIISVRIVDFTGFATGNGYDASR